MPQGNTSKNSKRWNWSTSDDSSSDFWQQKDPSPVVRERVVKTKNAVYVSNAVHNSHINGLYGAEWTKHYLLTNDKHSTRLRTLTVDAYHVLLYDLRQPLPGFIHRNLNEWASINCQHQLANGFVQGLLRDNGEARFLLIFTPGGEEVRAADGKGFKVWHPKVTHILAFAIISFHTAAELADVLSGQKPPRSLQHVRTRSQMVSELSVVPAALKSVIAQQLSMPALRPDTPMLFIHVLCSAYRFGGELMRHLESSQFRAQIRQAVGTVYAGIALSSVPGAQAFYAKLGYLHTADFHTFHPIEQGYTWVPGDGDIGARPHVAFDVEMDNGLAMMKLLAP